jgi:hypothetical protein
MITVTPSGWPQTRTRRARQPGTAGCAKTIVMAGIAAMHHGCHASLMVHCPHLSRPDAQLAPVAA